ncbi:MAG: hypothetical protein ACREQJ_02620 [Candidatus Binatia bacterium]
MLGYVTFGTNDFQRAAKFSDPPGSYTFAGTARGATQQRRVSLGASKQQAISFGW